VERFMQFCFSLYKINLNYLVVKYLDYKVSVFWQVGRVAKNRSRVGDLS